MVSVMSASRYITSASRDHPYVINVHPWSDSTEFGGMAEAVPIGEFMSVNKVSRDT